MKRFFILLFLMSHFVLTSMSQNIFYAIDSIKEASNNQVGVEKINTIIELSKAFGKVSIEDCLSAGEKAVALSKDDGYDDLQAKAYFTMANCLIDNDDCDLAKDYFSKAAGIYQKIGDKHKIVSSFRNIGYCEQISGDIRASLTNYQIALNACDSVGFESDQTDIQNNIAVLFFHMGNKDKSLEYFLQARRSYEKLNDTLSMAQCDNNIAVIYYDWQKSAEAKEIYERILPVLVRYGDSTTIAFVYRNLGLIYENDIVNLNLAIDNFEKSLIYCEAIGDSSSIADNIIDLGNAFVKQGKSQEGIAKLNEGLMLSERIDHTYGQLAAYSGLGIAYNQLGNASLALDYFHKCLQLEEESGINIYRPTLRRYMIIDFARSGKMDDMISELDNLLDSYNKVLVESNELKNQIAHYKYNNEELLWTIDNQKQVIAEQKKLVNRYIIFLYCSLAVIVCICLVTIFSLLRNKK